MNRLLNKSHFTFIIFIVVLGIFGLSSGNEALDLNVDDTMFVISYRYLSFLLVTLFTIISISYVLMDYSGMKFSNWLVFLQSLLSIPFIIALISSHFEDLIQKDRLLIFSLFLFTLGVLIFLINVLVGIRNKIVKTSG